MKCIPHTDPVSAMRAANGPWYQSVSKVSIPRPQTSCRPVAQWAATKAAARERQNRLGKGDCRGWRPVRVDDFRAWRFSGAMDR